MVRWWASASSPVFRALGSADDLRGTRAWERLLSHDDAGMVQSLLRDARTTHGAPVERSWLAPGSPLDVRWTMLAIPNPSGAVVAVSCCAANTSSRQRSEQRGFLAQARTARLARLREARATRLPASASGRLEPVVRGGQR